MGESQHCLKFFHYPEDNRFGIATRLRPRRIVERRVRDLAVEPLAAISIAKRPHTRRSGLLIYGFDLDAQAYRKFYVGSMRSVSESSRPLMRIGLYDPLENDEPFLYGRLFTDSRLDQASVRAVLREANEWLAHSGKPFVARLFPLVAGQKRAA
jgi:hypothetical protein